MFKYPNNPIPKNITKQNLHQKWALIALTRSVDSIVIHIEDKESYIGRKLNKIYKEGDDFIHWLEN